MTNRFDPTHFDDAPPPPGRSPWVDGASPQTNHLEIVEHDPAWAEQFDALDASIRAALGPVALAVTHVGSTAVPGLPAKPIIDIDLTVADSGAEQDYVPALTAIGFTLVIREPWWYGHRLLRHEGPATHLHVFSPDCAEAARHVIFRDWLRTHPEDRAGYELAKRDVMKHTSAAGGHMMDYNARKQDVIREIYARAFAALDG